MISARFRTFGLRGCLLLSRGRQALSAYEDLSARMASQCITTLTRDLMKPIMSERRRHEGVRVMKRDRLQEFVELYGNLPDHQKRSLLQFLVWNYGVDQKAIAEHCQTIGDLHRTERETSTVLSSERKLMQLLKPIYFTLFTQLGTLNNGVKFLIDMRHDALQFAKKGGLPREEVQILLHLSSDIKDILSMWFSVGLLQLRRITWETSAEILEKLAKYEAVHAIKNWLDLKYRLGQSRRCYAFFNTSMPNEPVIILHVALTKEISDDISAILDYRSPLKGHNATDAECAIFYSITSTQKGLQGIELGAYLVQSVVASLKQELPQLTTFSSLSPIPGFRKWLLRELNEGTILQSLGSADVTLLEQAQSSIDYDGDTTSFLKEVTIDLEHFRNPNLSSAIKEPLMKLCAVYLCKVKRRSYALNSVANFHLKNGAIVWRINWMADKSATGMQQSFGLMVNYRYFLKDMVNNSSDYIANQVIRTSDLVKPLLNNKLQSNL